MKKIVAVLILLMVLALQFSGCWDRRELEGLAIVQALALDPPAHGGKGVKVTTMIAIPAQMKGGEGGGGSEAGTFLFSMEAPTIYEAFNKINTTINREITLLQNSVIIVSDALAKKGMRPWLDNLVRYREMRRTVELFVSQGDAAAILKVQPKLEKNPSEYFRDLVSLSSRNGMFPVVDINQFMESMEAYAEETYAPYLAKYQQEDGADGAGGKEGSGEKSSDQSEPPKETPKDVRIIGTAIFKKDKMIGALDNYESQILLLLVNQFHEAFMSIQDPRKPQFRIVYRLLTNDPTTVKYRRAGDRDRFSVQVRVEADLVSIQSGIDYTKPWQEAFLSQRIAAELNGRIKRLIAKAQRQYDTDLLGFGLKVRESVLTSKEWEDYRWPDRFRDAEFATEVKVAIRRVGIQFQPPGMR